MKAKGAFLFVGGGVDKETAKSVVETKYLDLYVAGCKNYDEAEEIARALVADGCGMIELCAGFGAEGVARIICLLFMLRIYRKVIRHVPDNP